MSLVIFVTVLILLVFLVIHTRMVGGIYLNRANPIQIYLLLNIVLYLIPVLLTFFSSNNISQDLVISVLLSLLFYLIGSVSILLWVKKSYNFYYNYNYNFNCKPTVFYFKFPLAVKLLILLSILIVLSYISYIPNVPLFELLSGNHNVSELRDASMKTLHPMVYLIFEFNRMLLLPFISLYIMYKLIFERVRKAHIILFVFIFLLGFVNSAFSLAKSPPLIYLLLHVIMYLMIVRISSLKAFTLLITPVIFLIFFGLFINSGSDIWGYMLDLIGRRLFSLPIEVLDSYFTAFDSGNFLYGKSIIWLSGFSSERVILPRMIYEFMDHDSLATGWATAYYIGSAWANFGYLGIIILSYLIGVSTQYLSIKISLGAPDFKKVILNVLLFLYLLILLINSATGGVPMLVLFILLFSVYFLDKSKSSRM